MPSFSPVYIFIIALSVSIALGLYYVLSKMEEKSSARETLRQLDDYEVTNQRDKELLAPARDRYLEPAIAALSSVGSKFDPPNYKESVRVLHTQAGITDKGSIDRFLAFRKLAIFIIPFWVGFVFLLNPISMSPMLRLIMAAVGIAGLAIVPNSRLKQKVKERQTEIRKTLPDVLDLLVICVEAGLGFEQGVDRVVSNVPGELSKEFARMLGEITAGSNRGDALRHLQERVDIPEIRSFVLAMIQADTFGVSIGQVLRGQADEMRIKRRQLAQEKAQKAPVKMLIPMVFCIFPALFIVILGPALLNIMETL